MSGVIRTVPCGCESGQPCTPATRCAITTAVHIQREDDEAEMERLREDHEAELAALRAEKEKAEAERDSLRAAAMLAYGYLWSVQIEPGTPGLPPHKAMSAARIALRDALDNDERKAGIEQVRAALGKR